MANITFGSKRIFNDADTGDTKICSLTSTKVAVAFRDNGDSNKLKIIIGDISGDNISWGSEYSLSAGYADAYGICRMDNTHFVISYKENADSKPRVVCCSVSGNVITIGTKQVLSNLESSSMSGQGMTVCRLTDTKFAVYYIIIDTTWKSKLRACTISGTDITLGDEYAVITGQAGGYSASSISMCRMTDDQFVVSLKDGQETGHGQCLVVDVSGTELTISSQYEFSTIGDSGTSHTDICALSSTKFAVIYGYYDSSKYRIRVIIGDVSSSTISYGTPVQVSSDNGGSYGKIVMLSSTTFIISYTYGSVAAVNLGTVNGNEITLSNTTQFNNAYSPGSSLALLSSTSFILTFVDYGNSYKGTAMIGTVSLSSFIPRTMWFN